MENMEPDYYHSTMAMTPTVNLASLQNTMFDGNADLDAFFDMGDAFGLNTQTLNPLELNHWASNPNDGPFMNTEPNYFSNPGTNPTHANFSSGTTTAAGPPVYGHATATSATSPESNTQTGTTAVSEDEKPVAPVKKTRASRKRKKQPSQQEQEAKRSKFLERNRIAASKCRSKKKDWTQTLEMNLKERERERMNMNLEISKLKTELLRLKQFAFDHKDCNDSNINSYMAIRIAGGEDMSRMPSGSSLQSMGYDWTGMGIQSYASPNHYASPDQTGSMPGTPGPGNNHSMSRQGSSISRQSSNRSYAENPMNRQPVQYALPMGLSGASGPDTPQEMSRQGSSMSIDGNVWSSTTFALGLSQTSNKCNTYHASYQPPQHASLSMSRQNSGASTRSGVHIKSDSGVSNMGTPTIGTPDKMKSPQQDEGYSELSTPKTHMMGQVQFPNGLPVFQSGPGGMIDPADFLAFRQP